MEKKDLAEKYALKEYARVNGEYDPKSLWHSVKDGELPQVNKDYVFSYKGFSYIGYMREDKSVFRETQREKAHIRAICVGEGMYRLFQ